MTEPMTKDSLAQLKRAKELKTQLEAEQKARQAAETKAVEVEKLRKDAADKLREAQDNLGKKSKEVLELDKKLEAEAKEVDKREKAKLEAEGKNIGLVKERDEALRLKKRWFIGFVVAVPLASVALLAVVLWIIFGRGVKGQGGLNKTPVQLVSPVPTAQQGQSQPQTPTTQKRLEIPAPLKTQP